MKQVLIIGAGPAGLTAAYELLKHGGYQVTVLEATDRIGGISQTVRCGNELMDIGGHRFFSKDEHILAWWDHIMPLQGAPSLDDKKTSRAVTLTQGGPDPEQTDRVLLMRSRVSRIYYKQTFFDYPVSLSWKTLKNMGVLTSLQVGGSFLWATLHRRPNDNMENYFINSFGKKLYSMFFEGYTEKLWGRHPREIDASWGKQRARGLSIFGIFKDLLQKVFLTKAQRPKNIEVEEFRYPKYGPGQMWETVAEEILAMGGKICKNCKVTGIHTVDGKVISLQVNENGVISNLPTDAVFSSMPIKDLIISMNDVPQDVSRIATGLPYRDYVIVGLVVDRLNLKNETSLKTLGDIVPDCWIYVQDPDVKLGRIQIFNNWSPYLVSDPENTVWIGLEYFCSEGDDFWNMSEEECTAYAIKELTQMGLIDSTTCVKQSHREQVKKAYVAYFDTYDEIGKVITYLNSFENLYSIGRNGQHRYNNMDHAMMTAFEAVENFVNGGTTPKDKIWSVNSEQEYHETKK